LVGAGQLVHRLARESKNRPTAGFQRLERAFDVLIDAEIIASGSFFPLARMNCSMRRGGAG